MLSMVCRKSSFNCWKWEVKSQSHFEAEVSGSNFAVVVPRLTGLALKLLILQPHAFSSSDSASDKADNSNPQSITFIPFSLAV